MAYEDYIAELRQGPRTVEQLSTNLHFSVHTVRSAMSELEQINVVNKSRTSKFVTYSLNPAYQRDLPRIKVSGEDKRYIVSIDSLLRAYQKATEGIKALRAIPTISAELLVIGWKAQNAHDTMNEKELKKLSRRLKQLRLEVESHYYQAINNYQILQQLKNTEDFWTTEGLMKHYNPQTNEHGIAIPPIDPSQALSIYQNEQPD